MYNATDIPLCKNKLISLKALRCLFCSIIIECIYIFLCFELVNSHPTALSIKIYVIVIRTEIFKKIFCMKKGNLNYLQKITVLKRTYRNLQPCESVAIAVTRFVGAATLFPTSAGREFRL